MNIRADATTANIATWLPPAELRVTTTGAWARPGWHDLLAKSEDEGRLGPADIDELYQDYAVLAIRDQERCGLDVLTDGEVRRKSWIRYIVKNVPGLTPKPQSRKLGPHGWDQQETYTLGARIKDLDTIWNYVGEYEFLRSETNRLIKICLPGPYGITTQLDFIPAYESRTQCAEALVEAIREDIRRLVAAGCDYIQIEEALTPGVTADDRNAADMVRLINRCVDGINNCTFILHICFGSSHRLPYAKRTYKGLFPRMLDANVHGFSLEFAAREMSEIEIVGDWPRDRILSAGLIDIKTHYVETPDDIIERARICLKYRDPERLEISSDCGFRHVPRNLTIRKYLSAAEAARRLRASG
jgi:5-methyltetrahydropteroyltriglutamate--homocysteine methyltransferase